MLQFLGIFPRRHFHKQVVGIAENPFVMITASSVFPKLRFGFSRQCSSVPNLCHAQMLVDVVASGIGNLQDMESKLDSLGIAVTQSLVTHVIDSSTSSSNSCSRRLLRFVSWSKQRSSDELGDQVFNHAIWAFCQMKDLTAIDIAILDLQKEGRKIDPKTFVHVTETFVKLGKPEKVVSLFRNIEEKHKLQWRNAEEDEGWSSVTSAVHALCAKGYARKAQGILWHHRDKVKSEAEVHHNRSLVLHGWSVHGNAKEARRVIEEMKSSGNRPSIALYHDLLRCICKRNLKFNPSALVPEAINLMTEMRSLGVSPTTISFNIVLSCLGKARRVKESFRIFSLMVNGEEGEEATPDYVSYYVVIRLLYLTKRFGSGKKLLNQMIEAEVKGKLVPGADARFYHNLIGILCGMEEVEHALKLFERMKRRCCCDREEENKPAINNNCGPTYDLLIAKVCRNGKFDLGRHLWDEAIEQGITLKCSSNVLDPLKTPQVFNPTMRTSAEKINTVKLSNRKITVQKRKKGATANSSRAKKIKGEKKH